jgi:hypothetical protein
MYTLLHNKQWDNRKRYSIFGVPDIGDFTIAFGSWNPYDVAIKNVKQQNDIRKAEKIARVQGMKEGALSAPIIYYERDVRSTDGNFMPKVQTKHVSKVFQEKTVKRETKTQAINALINKLKTVNEEYRSVTQPKLPEITSSEPFVKPPELNFDVIDRGRANELLKEKEYLKNRLISMRSTHHDNYNNMTNFSQLIKNPDTIVTIADDFTIFDSAAYYKSKNSGSNEHVNDIRSLLYQIPSELMPHFSLTELMGPPELLPTGQDAYTRESKNPLQQKTKLQLTHDVNLLDIPNTQFTPKKAKSIEEKIEELTTPTPTKHFLNTGVKRVKKVAQPLFEPLTQEEINQKINLFSLSPSFHESPTKARLQRKIAQQKQSGGGFGNLASARAIVEFTERKSKMKAQDKINTNLEKNQVEQTPKKQPKKQLPKKQQSKKQSGK